MSKFFKALEQADRERALREGRLREESAATLDPGVAVAPEPDIEPVAMAAPPSPPPVSVPVKRVPVERPPVERAPDRLVVKPPVAKPARRAVDRPVRQLGAEAADGIDAHLVSLLTPSSPEAEQYRALRHLIEQLHRSANLTVLAVSSPAAGDGKTTTAINLAGALAQDPKARVLLVDADLRGSAVAQQLGLGQPSRGLVDAILDPGLHLDAVVRACPPFNVSVLPAGGRSSAPYELLKSPRLGELLDEARRSYDHIVVDTPPLVAFPDSRVIDRWVDGLLLVVRAHKTPRKLVEAALNLLEPGKLVGLLFNGERRQLSGYYDYSHGYGYGASRNGNRPGWLGRTLKVFSRSSRARRKRGRM